MWVYTNKGFFSIVEDKDNSTKLLVRARIKGDLERLFRPYFSTLDVEETNDADYRFRVRLDRPVVTNAIGVAVDEIDYTNFKNNYKDNDDIPAGLRFIMSHYMTEVWGSMWQAQHEAKDCEEVNETFSTLG